MYSERQREMLRYLSEVKFAKVEHLADLFHVSIETIRRDLLELEKDSSVKRIRGGVMGSAQTVNLLELVIDALYGRGFNVLEHLGAFLLYAAATMLTVLLPFWWSVNVRRLSPIITAAAAMAECFIPAETEIVIALYPIFFAMAFQWSSFRGARNFYSSTIFSTNNTKQASLALAEYLCTKNREQLVRMGFFLSTLLCFHIGAAVGVGASHLWGVRGALCALPLIGWAFFLVTQEEKAEAIQTIVTE